MLRSVLTAIVLIAFTDVALQLDNAIAISSVASTVPGSERVYVLAAGVLLAALCLLGFTIIGSTLVDRFHWLKPVAGGVLVIIGLKLGYDYFRP